MDTRLNQAINKIQQFKDQIDTTNIQNVKRGRNYLEWISKKSDLIMNEGSLIIPRIFLPIFVDTYTFNLMQADIQTLIKTYYFTLPNGNFRIDNRKVIPNTDIVLLAKATQLRRGKVVWAEFGFNVGEEFGGRHPALILK